jgi:S1-C subfamily serine protease
MHTVGRKSLWGLLLVLLLAALAAVLAQSLWTWGPTLFGRANAEPRAVTPRGDLAADEKSTIELFRQASPAVVYITTQVVRRDAFSLNLLEIPRGTGSGVVWDEQGHIVTNFHVIAGADRAQVTLSDWTAP